MVGKPPPPAKRGQWVNGSGKNFAYEVVDGDELREIINEWEAEWRKTRPSMGRGFNSPGYLISSKFLEEITGMDESRISAVRRSDHQKRKWISAIMADRLLTAIGRQHLLDNGTLRVVPNPRLSLERYQAWLAERGCV